MKPSLVVLTAVVILLAAVGASHLQAAPAASQASTPFLPTPPVGAPQQLVVYAHIKSIAAKGGSFEAKVDPAEYLSGETANRAAIADKVLQPGDTVPNGLAGPAIRKAKKVATTSMVPMESDIACGWSLR